MEARRETAEPEFHGAYRLESVESSSELEERIIDARNSASQVIEINLINKDGSLKSLLLDILPVEPLETDVGRVYVFLLLSGYAPGRKEVSIIISPQGGKALISLPY